MKKHWYHYLWIYSLFFFIAGFFFFLFAWLGLISFALPLIFAIGFGNKRFCNRYCDRGQLLRALGSQIGLSRGHEMPSWMKSHTFCYGFMVFFFAMFGIILYSTWLVAEGVHGLDEIVTILWTIKVPWSWAYHGEVAPWIVAFALKLYGFMMTSEIIALAAMLYYKPRSWCVFCPMGTLTQIICKARNQADDKA